MTRTITILLLILTLTTCQKIKYYPDINYKEVSTKFLCHRGGGSIEYSPEQENTLAAAIRGFTYMDGIEIDVQISKDFTVWLSHTHELSECGGTQYSCFQSTTDKEILTLDSCNGDTFTFTRLEEVFQYMSENCPDKYIDLDVKNWPVCGLNVDILGLMNVIGDEVIRLTEKYNLQNHIFVESEVATFLTYVKDHSSGIETYLGTTGDFERGMQITLEKGYTGMSFKFKADEIISEKHVQMIRQKGLKLQLYTVDSETDMRDALSINPDFIQTDNVDLAITLQ